MSLDDARLLYIGSISQEINNKTNRFIGGNEQVIECFGCFDSDSDNDSDTEDDSQPEEQPEEQPSDNQPEEQPSDTQLEQPSDSQPSDSQPITDITDCLATN